MSIEAMKQALEALDSDNPDIQLRAAQALRTAIAEAEKQEPVAWITAGRHTVPLRITPPAAQQEPVAWANINKHGDITHTNNKRMPWSKTPLYTTPPAAPVQEPVAWLGLEPSDMPDGDDPMYDHDFFLKGMAWADAILRKKNATPPAAQRQWVGLTDDELMACSDLQKATVIYFMKKLKEKNT
jgi:hypothetical protein